MLTLIDRSLSGNANVFVEFWLNVSFSCSRWCPRCYSRQSANVPLHLVPRFVLDVQLIWVTCSASFILLVIVWQCQCDSLACFTGCAVLGIFKPNWQNIRFAIILKWRIGSLYKSSAVAEMVDCGNNRHGPKRGGCCAHFASEAGSPSNTK